MRGTRSTSKREKTTSPSKPVSVSSPNRTSPNTKKAKKDKLDETHSSTSPERVKPLECTTLPSASSLRLSPERNKLQKLKLKTIPDRSLPIIIKRVAINQKSAQFLKNLQDIEDNFRIILNCHEQDINLLLDCEMDYKQIYGEIEAAKVNDEITEEQYNDLYKKHFSIQALINKCKTKYGIRFSGGKSKGISQEDFYTLGKGTGYLSFLYTNMGATDAYESANADNVSADEEMNVFGGKRKSKNSKKQKPSSRPANSRALSRK